MSSAPPDPAQGSESPGAPAPAAPAPAPGRGAERSQSLAVRIAAGLVSFVTAVLCLYAVFTLSVSENTVRGRIGDALDESLQRATAQSERDSAAGASTSPLSPVGVGVSLPTGAGHESGTLVGLVPADRLRQHDERGIDEPHDHAGRALDGYILDAVGGQRELTVQEAHELLHGLVDGPLEAATEVDLEGAAYMIRGERLASAASAPSGQVVVVGVPIDDELKVIAETRVGTLGSMAVIVIVVAIGSWAWVRRSLEPLADVASSANEVSALPVGSPGVRLADHRVPESASRRADEMAVVAAAFNRMLTSMDESLDERQRLEEKLRRFVADASHELRTPLASLRGYTEMIGLMEPLSERGRESLQRVLAQADRMGRLVDDLLFLARMDRDAQGRLDAGGTAGPGAGERRLVSLAQLVVEATQDARAAGPEHDWDVEISEEKVSQNLKVCGDPAQLERVVANLLSNARKHTPAGTSIWTHVDVVPFPEAPSGRGVRVVVQDDGPGIPEEIMPVLFDRFVRASTAREPVEGSTGLGLAVVRAVAEAHGGTVTVDSVPGRTRFVMTLPGVDHDGPAGCPPERASTSPTG